MLQYYSLVDFGFRVIISLYSYVAKRTLFTKLTIALTSKHSEHYS